MVSLTQVIASKMLRQSFHSLETPLYSIIESTMQVDINGDGWLCLTLKK